MTSFDDTMANLKQRFVARAREDTTALRDHQSGCRTLPPQELRAVVHRLAGCAGIFGYPALSAMAQEVDEHLAADNDARALPELLVALDAVIFENVSRPG